MGGLGAVLVCGVLCGILAYFLVPRNVDIFIAIPTRNELTGGDEFLYPNIDNIAAEADVF
jgi:hypothetical protein